MSAAELAALLAYATAVAFTPGPNTTLSAAMAANHAARPARVLPIAALFGFASSFTCAALGAALRRRLTQGERLLWFNRAMATVLAATALWVLGS